MKQHKVKDVISKKDMPSERKPIRHKYSNKKRWKISRKAVCLRIFSSSWNWLFEQFLTTGKRHLIQKCAVTHQKLNLEPWSLDVDTAFLNGELDEGNLHEITERISN
jgi:hypothetical protein